MAEMAAVVASIDKGKIVLEIPRGMVLQCEFVKGKLPKAGNRGIAVVDETARAVRFKGPRGVVHLRLL